MIESFEPVRGSLFPRPVEQVLERRRQVKVLVHRKRHPEVEVLNEGEVGEPDPPHRVEHGDLVQAVARINDLPVFERLQQGPAFKCLEKKLECFTLFVLVCIAYSYRVAKDFLKFSYRFKKKSF